MGICDLLKNIRTNEDFADQIINLKTEEARIAFIKEEGYDITDEDYAFFFAPNAEEKRDNPHAKPSILHHYTFVYCQVCYCPYPIKTVYLASFLKQNEICSHCCHGFITHVESLYAAKSAL